MNPDQVSADAGQLALQELAAEVLSKEQAAPGSQDPEQVRWAHEKLNGGGQTATPVPQQVVAPVQMQPPSQPVNTPVAAVDETVLQIQQTPGQTIQPTNKPNDGQGAPQ